MSFCRERTLLGLSPTLKRAASLRCNRFDHECCHEHRCKQVVMLAKSGKATASATFTTRPQPGMTPDQGAKWMKACLRKTLQRLNRTIKDHHWEYFAVLERHKSGWPHIHMLIRGTWVEIEELRSIWKEYTGAHRIELREIKDARGAARYATKYVGKGPAKFGTCKRYWTTRNWDLNKREHTEKREAEGLTWMVSQASPATYFRIWTRDRWDTTREKDGSVTARLPPWMEADP